jgi:hypothetical protein
VKCDAQQPHVLVDTQNIMPEHARTLNGMYCKCPCNAKYASF